MNDTVVLRVSDLIRYSVVDPVGDDDNDDGPDTDIFVDLGDPDA